ncbi:beta-defensin 1 [Dipodomys spectabilis]|uniref:beta-defensin 1 n=1 Tax=Dipodomys spectabilis TaxID=105255 RepID=UPI001C53AE9B|nr:beta-defensin 1 [Dipodomys spectabilis]
MRSPCVLLLLFCLLFCQIPPDAGLTGLGHRSDHYLCVKKGGFCLYSECPKNTKVEGSCYHKMANCCK